MWKAIGLLVIAEAKRLLQSHEIYGVNGHKEEDDFHEEEVHGFPSGE